jgi:hypothetical protein
MTRRRKQILLAALLLVVAVITLDLWHVRSGLMAGLRHGYAEARTQQ